MKRAFRLRAARIRARRLEDGLKRAQDLARLAPPDLPEFRRLAAKAQAVEDAGVETKVSRWMR